MCWFNERLLSKVTPRVVIVFEKGIVEPAKLISATGGKLQSIAKFS